MGRAEIRFYKARKVTAAQDFLFLLYQNIKAFVLIEREMRERERGGREDGWEKTKEEEEEGREEKGGREEGRWN